MTHSYVTSEPATQKMDKHIVSSSYIFDIYFTVTTANFLEPLRNARFRFFLRAKHGVFRKSPQRSGALFSSTQKVHRPGSQSPLHFDIRNIQQIRSEICFFQRSAFASRRHARALAADLPRQDHFYITTDELFRFRNDDFDEMLICWILLRIRIRSRNNHPHLTWIRKRGNPNFWGLLVL